MSQADSASHPEDEIEGLLTALSGVLAARVALSPFGRVEEIHILADATGHPKQVVRNVESALSAGLGITVDRRVISVAQVRAEDPLHDEPPATTAQEPPGHAGDAAAQEPPGHAGDAAAPGHAAPGHAAAPADASASAAEPQRPGAGRYIFVGYDARTQPDHEAACRVTIRRDDEVFSGTGTGPSTALGRAQSAARAVFAAIAAARRSQSLGLEGVTLVESHGRDFVLVAAHALHGRSTVPLTGIAGLHRSPEEAAILASLQATNRWNELDD
jgi:hypothetical protein